MRRLATIPKGLGVISDLYRDYLASATLIAFALFAGSYLVGLGIQP